MKATVFVAGATGYVGRAVIPRLLERGHRVRVLVRTGSQGRVPAGCDVVLGDALKAESFSGQIKPADTFLQLVGVAHPGPAKAREFRSIDLVSVQQSVAAASASGVRHFVYVSVAQPAPVMKEYQAVRAEGERLITAAGLNATFVRPWYVLGPGHRWPYLLLPFYWVSSFVPAWREPARRMGLVTLGQMVTALVAAIESPSQGRRIVEVPEIRSARLG